MRNEQDFKALVMQKVREQQHQKHQRLLKIRAATISLTSVCLVLIGVAAITWFVRINPSTLYGDHDDDVYSAINGSGGWFSWFSGVTDEEESWDNSSAAIKSEDSRGEQSDAVDTGNNCDGAEGQSTDAPPSQSVPNTEGDKPSGSLPNGDNDSESSNSDATGGTAQSVDSVEGTKPDSSDSANSAENTETSLPLLLLEEINPEMAEDLALTAGRVDENDATAIIRELNTILSDEARQVDQTDGVTLFVLRYNNVSYRFCEGNLMILSSGQTNESFAIRSSAYLRLLRLLQETKVVPNP